MEDKAQTVKKKEQFKQNPKSNSSVFGHFLFCWELPVIFQGGKKSQEDLLYSPLQEYESRCLGDKLESAWCHQEKFSKKPSLWKCIIKLFMLEFMIYGGLFFISDIAVAMLRPFFLKKLLDYHTPNQTSISKTDAMWYGAGLTTASLIRTLSMHFTLFASNVVGMKVRIACSSLIYRRSLTMNKSNHTQITMGKIINLLSNDLGRFEQVGQTLHFIWIGILDFFVIMFYVDTTIGHSTIAGGGVILLFFLLQVFIASQMKKQRILVAEKTDYRIRLMNDIICGIEAIKMYTWEIPFAELVKKARGLEMKQIRRANIFRLFNSILRLYMPKLCVYVTIIVSAAIKVPLTSQFVFETITIYETLKLTLMVLLPYAVILFSEALISVQRVQDFLFFPKMKMKKSEFNLGPNESYSVTTAHHLDHKKVGINLDQISVKWDRNYVLENISFKAEPNDFLGIIGQAGSGKSTLLHVILKEVEVLKGKAEINGSISYASQDTWIFASSIRQNILFGEEFFLDRYEKVIQVCALERDLTLMPFGDQTLVGERGVMLSGGQKARINLARAIYKQSDIYLLDDPLSAVDAHVARHIFDDCIRGHLKEKCVVLVTHQVHYLQTATKIYHLDKGKVVKSGNYEEVIGQIDILHNVNLEPPQTLCLSSETKEETKEIFGTKSTSCINYQKYGLAAGHSFFGFLVLFLFLLGQVACSSLDCFVSFWANQKTVTTEHCIYIYTGLMIISILLLHFAGYVFTAYCTKASITLHNNMLSKMVQVSMNFFNHNPSGRLLNRFSKDIGAIDEMLPFHLINVITAFFLALTIFVIIALVNTWLLVPSLIFVLLALIFAKIFQSTNRNIKQSESCAKSNVFTHVAESLKGLVTIRAHGHQMTLIQEFDNHQNLHSSALYLFQATFAAFGFWTDILAIIFSSFIIFSFFFLDSGVANIGLAITQSINFLGLIQFGFKTFGELDSHMTSVERVLEYAELDPEPDEGKETPVESWPQLGDLEFDSVDLRYGPEKPVVIKNATFSVKSGEKVGIVGRTGAGKSSLISILFRLFHFDGSVIIDRVQTKAIPLNALRSKISIIPQEPVLFLGTLRKNIDPFDEFSDSQLWHTLEDLEMKDMISVLPLGLESVVTERGANFSVGQRQLLCLVRAMLRNNKIIVLDEATANVDLKTDELIQSLIRRKFRDCTVLTIAHRLNTIIDSDKILTMDCGRVVEFDDPYSLLVNSDSHFYGLVKKNGEKVMKDFVKVAKAASLRRVSGETKKKI